MAEVVLYHHAQGLTEGVQAFAATLRGAGHTVHVPDLYEGRTFDTLEEGVSFAQGTGFDTILARGVAAAEELGDGLVYAGFSLGVMPAQKLAQTRPGAKGALLFYSCLPVSEFGDVWPADVPVQIHGKEADPYFAGEGDIDAARELVASTERAELFVYPGDEHLFADSSLTSYDEDAANLLMRRVLEFGASGISVGSPGHGVARGHAILRSARRLAPKTTGGSAAELLSRLAAGHPQGMALTAA